MHIIIQQRKETRSPKGSVYREIQQREDSPTFYGVGEPISREPKTKYDIRLKDGAAQHHLCTVTYWDIVDGWSGGILCDSIESHLRVLHIKTHGFAKEQRWEDLPRKLWQEYEGTDEYNSAYTEISRLAYLKFQPIIDMVEEEYANSEEGEIKAEQDRIKEEAVLQWEREQKVKEQERAEYARKSNEYARSEYQQFFGGNVKQSVVLDSERDMAQELVKAGYKALSLKYHPDIGGSHDDFVMLGKVKDKLIGI